MSITQIKVVGFGGQGVVLTGTILGKAGALFDGQFATMIRSYGPEARGGACSSQIIIADEPITYPYVTQPDILIALSQEACERYLSELSPNGTLLYESELVKPNRLPNGAKSFGIPCTRMAQEMGNRLVLNIMMLGCLAKISSAISRQALEEAIRTSVPAKTIDLNLQAFNQGYDFLATGA